MKFQKILALICVFTILFTFTACGKQTPSDAIEQTMQTLTSGDEESLKLVFGENAFNNENGTATTDENTAKKIYKAMISNLTYEITNVTENAEDNTAVVTMNVTNVALGSVTAKYWNTVMTNMMSYAFLTQDPKPTEDEIKDMMLQWFIETYEAEDLETVTASIDVHMTYVDDAWQIDNNDNLIDAIIGGNIKLNGSLADIYKNAYSADKYKSFYSNLYQLN